MIVCPVCEHAQLSPDECERCGKRFQPGPAGGDVPAGQAEWLEGTALGATGGVAVPPLPGLEPTLHAPVAAVEPVLTELEPTRAVPVEVAAERVPGFEPTEADAIPGERPSSMPAVLVCRYCRTQAAAGEVFCGRCGMRLPVLRPVAPPAEAEGPTPCPSCGTPGEGERCIACGGRRGRQA